MTTLTHLECSRCAKNNDPAVARNVCECGGPLLARYDLEAARSRIQNAPASMWRYAPVLPVRKPESIVSLGEGMTPLIHARRLGERLGCANLWIKDEGRNPTASVKAREASCAVSMAVDLGISKVTIKPDANGASALAAYAAAAGIEARVEMPADAPRANHVECGAYGAAAGADGIDLSAYRVEGAKTLGYEIAEQMAWTNPDAVVIAAGDGVALAGIAKAFEEMAALGWSTGARPRLIAVGAEITQREILTAAAELAACEGLLAAPEGAAAVAALPKLLAAGLLKHDERIVVVNTASGLKYLESYSRFARPASREQDKLAGLITPR